MTFLVSDDARWITGDTIAVYGGSKLSAAHAVDVRLGPRCGGASRVHGPSGVTDSGYIAALPRTGGSGQRQTKLPTPKDMAG
jgi:hypothetical protein